MAAYSIHEKIEKTIQADGVVDVELRIWDTDIPMRVEGRNGDAVLSLNRLLKYEFEDEIEPRSGSTFYDKSIAVRATIDGETIMVSRGRVLPKSDGLLTEIPLKKYDGFPLIVTYLSGSDIYCAEVSAQAIAAPTNPFYIRWIGRYGGYESLMLTCKQVHSASMGKLETYERVNDMGNIRVLNNEGKHTISASTGIVHIDTLKALTSIAYSPKIEYYDQDEGEWRTMFLDKGTKIRYKTTQPNGEVELTFELTD